MPFHLSHRKYIYCIVVMIRPSLISQKMVAGYINSVQYRIAWWHNRSDSNRHQYIVHSTIPGNLIFYMKESKYTHDQVTRELFR